MTIGWLVMIVTLLALALSEGVVAAAMPAGAAAEKAGPAARRVSLDIVPASPSLHPAPSGGTHQSGTAQHSDGPSVGTALSVGVGARDMPLSLGLPSATSTGTAKSPAVSDAIGGIGRSDSRGGSFVARVLALGAGGLAALQSVSSDIQLRLSGMAALISAVFSPGSNPRAAGGGLTDVVATALLGWAAAVAAGRIFQDYRGRLTRIFSRPLMRPG